MNKTVCVVTGTRAEYGLLKPVMSEIEESDKLELQLVVTGMHLMSEFGSTKNEITKDGFDIDKKIQLSYDKDDRKSMVNSMGEELLEINEALDKLDPEIVLVLGDRFEILGPVISAAYTGKAVAHINGGDKTKAGYDEYTRHAVTKLAHIHFPTTEESKERIIKMGEDEDYIHNVGSTAVDTIKNSDLPSKESIAEKYSLNFEKPIFLMTLHPVSTDPENAKEQIEIVTEAVDRFDAEIVGIYPNMDPGGRGMISYIENSEFDNFNWFKSLAFEDYLAIMKNSDVMIGNSSSGIIEAPYFDLPFVNIGERQDHRTRSNNVLDVDYDKNKIKEGIDKARDKKFLEEIKNSENPYGEGKAGKKIVAILEELKISEDLLKKQIQY